MTGDTMPNHCCNDLYVTGPEEEVAALLTAIGAASSEPAFDFSVVIPYPKAYADLDNEYIALGYEAFHKKYGPDAKDGFNSGGHEWRIDHWGTKWEAHNVVRRDVDGLVCVSFRTAWQPPCPVIPELHRRFPKCTLHLEYFEGGMGFAGGFSCLSAEDWYDESVPWTAGTVSREWKVDDYRGCRGG